MITVEIAKAWLQAGEYVRINDHNIFVMRAGDTSLPTLLLIHGYPTSSLDWQPMWGELCKRYRVITVDLLGFGFSDKPRQHTYSIHEQADIVQAVLQHFNMSSAHLLVHDYGVSIGQELLARLAERSAVEKSAAPRSSAEKTGVKIESCCFLNGGLLPGMHRPRLIQRLLAGPLGFVLVKFLNKRKLKQTFAQIFGPHTQPTDAEIDAYWYCITYNDGHRIAHKLLHYMQDRLTHQARWRQVLTAAPCPLALINGSFDPISGRHLADAVAALNRQITVFHLAEIGHYPQVESPLDVLTNYLAWRSDSPQ
jgi:pimeloyl-ACP methyl ester carboxylesterase